MGLVPISLKFTFTKNGWGAHFPKSSTLCVLMEIGRQAFLLPGDVQSFFRNLPPRHSVKVKLFFGEIEFL